MTRKYEEVEKAKRKAVKLEEKVEESRSRYDQLTQAVATNEEELAQIGDIDDVVIQKEALDRELRANKTKLQSYKVWSLFKGSQRLLTLCLRKR